MQDMADTYGKLDEAAAVGRIESVFRGMRTDWILPGTPDARERIPTTPDANVERER